MEGAQLSPTPTLSSLGTCQRCPALPIFAKSSDDLKLESPQYLSQTRGSLRPLQSSAPEVRGPHVFHTLTRECQKHPAGSGAGTVTVLVAAFCSACLKAHHNPERGVYKETKVTDDRGLCQGGGEGQRAKEDSETKQN